MVREAEAGGKTAARGLGSDGATAALRGTGRLFIHEADEGLEILAKRSDDLARVGRRAETTGEALLERRFTRLDRPRPRCGPDLRRAAPAEKRLVVEMGETAQRLARRYPGQAEGMIQALGTEGLSAVRVFGDDVAEVIVKEGPESLGVLRKTGRGGWAFFTSQVLPHKKKLLAGGRAGGVPGRPRPVRRLRRPRHRVRRPRVRPRRRRHSPRPSAAAPRGGWKPPMAEAGRYGLNFAVLRYLGVALAGLVVVAALLVLVGLPGPLDAQAGDAGR